MSWIDTLLTMGSAFDWISPAYGMWLEASGEYEEQCVPAGYANVVAAKGGRARQLIEVDGELMIMYAEPKRRRGR